MNKSILNSEVQKWISDNLNSDITKLILKGSPFDGIDIKDLIEQVESKKKAEKKLPTWFNTPSIYYPKKLSIEQTSSEGTAKYKANLISGDTLIDLTAGFGIDDYYFAKNFNQVTACEINEDLSIITQHNFSVLDVQNITCKAADGVNLLKESNNTYDWIYIDPARRNDSKGKVFLLADCLPNVPAILDLLLNKSNNILIKTSPMLDINQGIMELKNVKEIHVVALNNEVKELLWVLNENFNSEPTIRTVNITSKENKTFTFHKSEELKAISNYEKPQKYLYDPNTAIRKAGAFKYIGKSYNLNKLNQHAHLYTNNELVDFPGRRFEIKEVIPYNTKKIKQLFKNQKVNIITRNFPLTPQVLKKQIGNKDGGEVFLFFTTDFENNKVVLVAEKINS